MSTFSSPQTAAPPLTADGIRTPHGRITDGLRTDHGQAVAGRPPTDNQPAKPRNPHPPSTAAPRNPPPFHAPRKGDNGVINAEDGVVQGMSAMMRRARETMRRFEVVSGCGRWRSPCRRAVDRALCRAHPITSQWPPLSGPTRRIIPFKSVKITSSSPAQVADSPAQTCVRRRACREWHPCGYTPQAPCALSRTRVERLI